MSKAVKNHKIIIPPNADPESIMKRFAIGFASIYIARVIQHKGFEFIAGLGAAVREDKKALNDAIGFTRALHGEMAMYMSSEEKANYDQKADAIWKFCEHIQTADVDRLDYFIKILSDAVNSDVVLACSAEEYDNLIKMHDEENPSAPTLAQWNFMKKGLTENRNNNLESRINALERHWYGVEPEPVYTEWAYVGEGYEGKITLTQAGYGVFISGKRTATYGPYQNMAKAKSVFGNFTKIKKAQWQGIA